MPQNKSCNFFPYLVTGLFLFFLFPCHSIRAQEASANEWNHWYFGDQQAIRFDANPPTVLSDSRLVAWENCATVSDVNGKLLLYTDGDSLYDGSHKFLGQLTPSWGKSKSSCWAGTIIIRQPGQDSLYYVFLAPPQEIQTTTWFEYAVVNIKTGQIRKLEQLLNESPGRSIGECAGIVRHNSKDAWWIVSKNKNREFIAYYLDAQGLNTNGVISDGYANTIGSFGGYVAFSPDGKMMAHGRLLYSFDANTGQVTGKLSQFSTIAQHLAFSPNGKYLYYKSNGSHNLYQVDVSGALSSGNITEKAIYAFDPQTIVDALMLAHNGVIYINTNTSRCLSTINKPNKEYPACDFRLCNISLSNQRKPDEFAFGLPIVPSTIYDPEILTLKTCYRYRFYLSHFTNQDSIRWQYQNPDNGDLETSNSDTLDIYYSKQTATKITLTLYYPGKEETLELDFSTGEISGTPTRTKYQRLCGDKKIQLSGRKGQLWHWNSGAATRDITIDTAGIYWVETINSGCRSIDSFIIMNQDTSLRISLPKELLMTCNEKFATLQPDTIFQGYNYQWSTGESSPVIEVNRPGVYTLQAKDDCGNTISAQTTVSRPVCYCPVHFPNSFTPNGDLQNDQFGPASPCEFTAYNFAIFNRWGERIFETETPGAAWDGTFKGQAVQEGVYLYMLRVQFFTGAWGTYKGTVHLLR